MKFKYIILGAGPSGLTFAHTLIRNGHSKKDILIIEKNEEAGGLCRSKILDGAPIDIGGGHFLDIKNEKVLNFLFEFMPKNEWNLFDRVAKINYKNKLIDHPFESNIWQLDTESQLEFLESIAKSGSQGNSPKPNSFIEWIYWKFGDKIANEYMIPYNKKIWSIPLENLGTYWLEKLPSVSFRQVLESIIDKQHKGSLAAHAQFLYPKTHGYGEVWNRMAKSISENIQYSHNIKNIDTNKKLIDKKIEYSYLITTIPWTEWLSYPDIPQEIKSEISTLKFASIDIDYQENNIESNAHWIYEPDIDVSYHRILNRSKFTNGRGYWTETNSKRTNGKNLYYRNKHAYPINTINKIETISKIKKWANNNNIIPIGRWGLWEHINSDVAVNNAMSEAIKWKI